MGVRGLTTYIAQRADFFLVPYELHDCSLVIDGDNLACNLYTSVTGTYSAFGGDYDDFYRAVVNFFKVLKECNIQPFVLCDGGYEVRKMGTVATRLRGKIALIKKINPNGSVPIFPILLKEVFVDALNECGVPMMRCIFEADDELAALSRKLRCPVLSYDSDFYIHNVRYIPLVTLTIKAHKKIIKEDNRKAAPPTRNLRKNEAKHLEKRMMGHRIMGKIHVENDVNMTAVKQGAKSYKYLDCCMYRIEHLISRRALDKPKLPLFAALLGNDYIERSAFGRFYAIGALGKSTRSRKVNQQQRRIRRILEWLKHETLESALQKILQCLKKDQRESLLDQVSAATAGYSNEKCHSYDYFVKNYPSLMEKIKSRLEDADGEVDELDELENNILEIESDEESNDEEETLDNAMVEEALKQEKNIDEEDNGEYENEEVESTDKIAQLPNWFVEKMYDGGLPRFLVDLVHLRKYINSPQIEHFPYNDCHELALPILIYTFTLLHSAVEGVNGAETPKSKLNEDGTVLPIEFTYLTRALRVTNILYKRYGMITKPLQYSFNPYATNPLLMRYVFEELPHLDSNMLFEKIDDIPAQLRLYFLAIVYWLHKSQHCDLLHLHALLICLVVLQINDAKIPVERDLREFERRFSKIIKRERLVREKEAQQGIKRAIKPGLKALSIPARMQSVPKSDCYLVQSNLLKHFHMQEIFKKKYDDYSTIVLHGFAEFQCVVFQLHALNGLIDFPYGGPYMGQLFCGVFIYNIYDLLKGRDDVRYHVQNFLLQDSPMMFDYYCYLYDWCLQFLPQWKQTTTNETSQSTVNRRTLKKQRQAERKKSALENAEKLFGSNAEMLEKEDSEDDEFFDLNNKFCSLLRVS